MIALEHSSFVSKTASSIIPCPRAISGREKAPSSDFCHSSSPDTPAPCFVGDNFTANLAGVQAAECLTCPSHLESAVFDAIMKEISLLPVKTVGHLPRSVRPLFAKIYAEELRHATHNGIWGFTRLHLFPNAVLRCPPHGGKKKRYVVKGMLKSRLEQWESGDIMSLWRDARCDASNLTSGVLKSVSVSQRNTRQALTLAREGRYSNAMRTLGSLGTAAPGDLTAICELQQRHPSHDLPPWVDDIPPSLTVSSESVLTALCSFPRATSPGASQLQSQHLLDAIEGTTAPVAKVCLDNLSHLMCHLLSGKADVRIAPWFCGAPLTALLKKQGGIRPIAVGEVLRHLASRLCCSHVKSSLPMFYCLAIRLVLV